MIERIVMELGSWNWMAIGLALLALEIVVPGFFLLWIGIAAILVGTLALVIGEASFFSWHVQVLLFLVLSLIAAYVGKRIMGRDDGVSEEPMLNQISEQLVGRTGTLTEPIVNSRGRVRLGDTQWRVTGPDLPAGSTIRVVSAKGAELGVEAA
jgi:inner membrane protein